LSLAPSFETAGAVCLGLAVCGAVYAALATGTTWLFLRRRGRPLTRIPTVSVLKPLYGDEPQLYENLVSFCEQDYPGPVQLILAVQDPADAALIAARRLKQTYPDRDIVLTCDPTLHGSNRKIGNLINCAAQARGEIIVISDSDVRMAPDGLGRIVAALEEPRVGLVYALYRGRPMAGLWSRLAAMDINTRFAASVVVGEVLGAHPCLGPTMALRAGLLDRIGGFQYLADFLADDFELGRAVRREGFRIACPPMLIDHVFPEACAGEMLTHELRWARTIRLLEPSGYLGSVITHFLPLALIGAALSGFSPVALTWLGVLAAFRGLQGLALCALLRGDRGVLWLLPLRDVISFGVFIVAIFGNRVAWRGKLMRFRRNGAMAAT
jgi:ceramide glucosyltransferase